MPFDWLEHIVLHTDDGRTVQVLCVIAAEQDTAIIKIGLQDDLEGSK